MKKLYSSSFGIDKWVWTACIIILSQASGLAQVTIGASVSNLQPSANEEITITLSIAENADFHYCGTEVSYPAEALEFIAVENTGLSSGGLQSAGMIADGTIGVSVSRTSALASPSSGDFLILRFRLLSSAYAGSHSLTFANMELYDSGGNEILFTAPPDVALELQESIGMATLTIPAASTVVEGDAFDATASLFATGVTDTSRITSWTGVSDQNTDPATWGESAWQEMDYSDTDGDDNLLYSLDVAYMRPVGTWYIAQRAQLDDGSYVYAGTNGFWDAAESPSASLTITESPSYRYTLAEWNFDDESLLPSRAAPANWDAAMGVTGATFEGFSTGTSGQAANSNGWDEGAGTKYWSVTISTAGFAELQVSSGQYGSGTGPRDFRLETSTDGVTWEPVSGDTIRVATNWSSGVIENLPLSSSLDNLDEVHIRWVMVSDSSINGGPVSTTGTSRLDEVVITGINPTPLRVDVYPGDANNDGTVDADDVLALGTYWMNTGPVPLYNSLDWAPREVEQWLPPEATYADARGDGQVDHRDLMPVGLHFDQTVGGLKRFSNHALAEMVFDKQSAGTIIPVALETSESISLRGIALGLKVEGISPDRWEIVDLEPVCFDERLRGDLLFFDIKMDQRYETAYAIKGMQQLARSSRLVAFGLRARQDWTGPATLSINRVTIRDEKGKEQSLPDINLLPTGIDPLPKDHVAQLMPIRPNPFLDIAIVPYELSERTHVRLDILNLHGQVMVSLVDKMQQAGMYNLEFDGSELPSGVYFCRLTTKSGYVESRKMILLH